MVTFRQGLKESPLRPKQTFLQRRPIDGTQTHEKMLSTASYWKNVNLTPRSQFIVKDPDAGED